MAEAGPLSTPSGRFPALPKYEILDELGHGGMATVYRAHDKRLGRDVAIKVLHPHLRDNREIAHRFGVEAKAVARLRHPNIVEVFDVSEPNDNERYLVVELVRGTTLRRVLEDRGALPPEVAAALALEILSGLAAAHAEGVIHRDVKPENVLLEHPHLYKKETGESLPPRSNPNDKDVRVKLTDFGIAKMLDAQGVTSTGQVLGSPAHMAPEQIEGGEVDARADVFGMGVLLYETMVGHLPFEGSNPAQVLRRVLEGTYNHAERDRPVVGKDWSAILDRALALNPDQRYANTEEMSRAMRELLKTLGIDNPRVELEAYFQTPEAYEKEHTEKMVVRLKELGAQARKADDVQGAANAFNRALAYAPSDPELLSVVASLTRAEERKQMARRAVRPIGVVVLLGLGAFAVTRLFTSPPPVRQQIASASPPPSAPVSVAQTTSAAAPTTSGGTMPRKVNPITLAAQPMPPVSSTRKETHPRSVNFATVKPLNGVQGTIDGKPIEGAIGSGRTFVLPDNQEHQLLFTCMNDLCEPLPTKIEAGDDDKNISFTLKIRDATLTVDGPPNDTFTILSHPEITIVRGHTLRIPMSGGNEPVTVKDLSSGATKPATLVPGKPSSVDFNAGGAP